MRHVVFFHDGKKDIVISSHNKELNAIKAREVSERRSDRYNKNKGFHFIAQVSPMENI